MHNAALELFNDRLPHKPNFSDDLHFGVHIEGKERAIFAKYIQFNQSHAMLWLGFDVDRVGAAIDWSDRNASAPMLTITHGKWTRTPAVRAGNLNTHRAGRENEAAELCCRRRERAA